MSQQLKILIVRLSAIGDVVHSLPVLNALKDKYPDAFIGWAVEDKAADLIINNPLIDKAHILPKRKWKERGFSFKNLKEFSIFINEIKQEKYDIAIDLQELFKSASIVYLSGAKRRIAHAHTREFADLFVNEKLKKHDIFDPNKPIIERYLEAAQYLGASVEDVKFSVPPVDEENRMYVDELMKGLDKSKPVIAFSPATIWQSKHWEEDYWSQLLDSLADTNNIIFTGVQGDIPLINRITTKSKSENYIILAGKTNIKQLIEVFNRTDIVVAPDTGPVHIANAVNKPEIICIFGSTSAKRSGPYGEKHISLSADIPCQPCFKRTCPKKYCKMECVKKITPNQVISIINRKLTRIKNV